VERGDYKTMVECMPAGMVKRMGGVKDLSSRIKAGMEMLATMGVKPLDFRVGEVAPIVRGEGRLLTVVPTYVRAATQADQVIGVIHGYLIGLSEDEGGSWSLVDNEVVSEETAASLFPELVSAMTLPETRVVMVDQTKKGGKTLLGMTVQGRLQQVRERIKQDSAAGLYKESGGGRKE